jgi:cytochrome c-type biogenesis protein CcsB
VTENLELYSIILIYSAMAIYALAFIAFAFDLARRAAGVKAAEVADVAAEGTAVSESADQRELAGVSAAKQAAAQRGNEYSSTSARAKDSVGQKKTARGGASGPEGSVVQPRAMMLRLGVSLTLIGFVLHLGGVVLRGIAANRVPWANMYEFSITGTLLMVAVFLVVLTRQDLRFLGTFMTGLVLVLLGISTVNYYVSVIPLPPALQSAWLVIHVFVASLATAFFALGFALSVIQLLQSRRETATVGSKLASLRLLKTLPSSLRLENLAYRVNIIGFAFWTFTLIAGAVWAERAWGRYWGWDTKEVWTFIIWVIYAGYIHARATKGWRGSRSAWLAIIGFAAVLFNFGIVNIFFKGLHAYSGL